VTDRDIFVISDLHLGDGSLRDKFEAGGKTPELHAFLEHVAREGGELFILGDLFELWQMNLSLLLLKRRALLDHLAALDVVFVPGNHDVDLAHFIGTEFLSHPFFKRMRPPFVRELGGRRFRFFHGHETDPWNAGDDPGFGRMLSIFAAVFEDRNGSPFLVGGEGVGEILEQFGESMLTIWKSATAAMRGRPGAAADDDVHPTDALTPVQNPDRLVEHVQGVRADLEARGDDVAVLGHTHKPGRIGDWYFNSGSWAGRANTLLRISPRGEVRYLEWTSGRAVRHPMPVVLPEPRACATPPPLANPFDAAASAARLLFPRPTKPDRSRWVLIGQGAIAIAVAVGVLTVSVGRGSPAGWRVLVSTFGGYALLDGAMSLVGASRARPLQRLLSRVRGVVSVLLGLVVLRRGYVTEVFVVLAGVWAFVSGALRVAAAVVFKGFVDSRWLFVAGSGTMIGGVVLLLVPASAPALKYGLAAYLGYYGAGELLAGIFGQWRPRPASWVARAWRRKEPFRRSSNRT
jgi:UDP-2,3-diacylglucosamine pyrophosphatase LpxH/uncharacterized membrane protein HdeD (DUF308 family)